MLNKETKNQAERMAQELAPLFATISKLGQKLRKASEQTRHAHQVAIAWQYPDHKAYADDANENYEEIKGTRENNPHQWHEILATKYNILNECETLEKVARLNYRNYCAYICDFIANQLHTGDTWAKFYEKKGLETLAQFLKENAKQYDNNIYISIERDGTGFESFGKSNFYCYLYIRLWGVCCVRANNWGTYSETLKEKGREWTKPEEPKLYTLKQYIKLVKELKELENQAKAKAREHHEKARKTGLIYFVGGLSDPHLEQWGKND